MAQDDHAVTVIKTPNYNEKTTNKPVYIVSTECPENKGKLAFYKGTTQSSHEDNCLLIKGIEITKQESEALRENPNTEIESKKGISVEVPWQKVIRIISMNSLSVK